jgi:MFS family permease
MSAESGSGAASGLLGPYRVLKGNRNLDLLFLGQVVSSFGDWLYIIALIAVAFEVTRSATVVALLTFVRLLPYALFLPLAGVLADRFNRKALMITADVGRAACMLGLLAVQSRATLWIAFPIVFATTSLSSLFRPALNSVLPDVVATEDDLAQANGLMSQMTSLAFVLGPMLAGLLILVGSPRFAFLINGATFLLSALLLLPVRVPGRIERPDVGEGGWLGETLGGFRFLFRENDGVLAAFTVAVAGLTLLGGAFWTLSVVLAEQAFDLGAQGTGFLNSAYGVGGVIGGFLAGPLIARFRLGWTFIAGTALSTIVFTLFALSPAGVLPFVLLAVSGAADIFTEVSGTTVLQSATPSELLGRVFGAFEATIIMAMLVGSLVAGPLIDAFGPRAATVILAGVAMALLLVCLPRLRRLEGALGVRIFLRQVPAIAMLPHKTVEEMASRVQLERVADGEVIVHEGERGDRLFIIKTGEALVAARGAGQRDVSVATLGKSDYFGEIALLRDVPRTATVRAQGEVELYSLERAAFQELLGRSDELRVAMSGTGDARYIDTQNRLLMRL